MKYLFDGNFFPHNLFASFVFKDWLRQSGYSQHKLAVDIKSTQSTISRIASRNQSAGLLAALKICHASKGKIQPEDLLSSYEIQELEQFKGQHEN